MTRQTSAIIAAALIALAVATPAIAGDLDRLAAALSKIRGEVETLSAEIRDLSEDRRVRLRALAAQRTDMELDMSREEMRLRHLQERKQTLQTRAKARDANSARLEPAALDAIATVRASVAASLPFERDDRLQSIDDLRKQLEEGLISPQQALWRLWERVEDEHRLARENAIHQQIIELGDESVLADVARMGMVMMVFRTRDGRFGKVQRTGDAYQWTELHSKEDRARVAALFDALRKNIRAGHFELPGILPEETP